MAVAKDASFDYRRHILCSTFHREIGTFTPIGYLEFRCKGTTICSGLLNEVRTKITMSV